MRDDGRDERVLSDPEAVVVPGGTACRNGG